ncbi:hypothetical protein N7G274_001099 [Stereocaulon virgatum]|uniref:CorA-like transporter domain-containing protein n=1 Tax=Stereocaulon virgatum TaxID=373712 RepID=A0ABR4ANQ0_9LECA
MKTSPYFEQVLFYGQSAANDQFFEDRSEDLFQLPGKESFVEIHDQLPWPQEAPNGSSFLNSQKRDDSMLSDDFSSVPSSPLDQCLYLDEGPPRYVEFPGLRWHTARDSQDLKQIAEETRNNFRICFIRQRHSHSRLLVTRELFEALMSELHVLPRFREFVLLFGAKHGENELEPPQLRFRRLQTGSTGLRRQSCPGFDIAYGLRYVELNGRDEEKPWSIRQTAIYHKYRADGRSSTWIMIAASRRTEICLDRYVRSCTDIAALNAFEIHVIVLDTALGNWRPYVIYLTERVAKQSENVLVASIDEDESSLQPLDVEERQKLKDLEDQIIDIISVLDATNDNIVSLLEKYKQFRRDFEEKTMSDIEFDTIEFALQERRKDVVSNRKKVETLHVKIKSTIELLSSLLDLGTGNSLKSLAEEARTENLNIRKLTAKGTRDAAAVKVLTIITLIYLPATVVSNFFSTQFVTQVRQDNGSNHVVVLQNAWLFAAISVPLTLITLCVWWLWAQVQARQMHPQAESLTPLKRVTASRVTVQESRPFNQLENS